MKHLLAAILIAAALPAAAQTTPAAPAETTIPKSAGKVILSRSTDENGQTTTQGAAATTPPKPQSVLEPAAQDAERQAVTFTDFDMDVHLRPADQHIAVRALLTVRNDSKSPLAHIPLQLSSQLTWERIRVNLHDVQFPVATLNSDTDHTGQLHEAAVPLAQPLAPGQTLQLDVAYSGQISANAQRLFAIGTPDDVALHSDWDRIATDFTGLRGFGNVVWYPVSTLPVILGDGARLFDEIGQHKLRLAGAHFHLRLTVEIPHGRVPTIALINGHPFPLTVTDPGTLNQDIAGVATADNGSETLGFEAPSIFVAIRTPHPGTNCTLWAAPDDEASIQSWSNAATVVTPFLQSWLGQRPRSQLTLLDLPDPQDAPFESGALLATAFRAPNTDPNPDQFNAIMAHALTHAWMQSPRAWLSEGVAHFMGTLWIEKTRGRDQALESLEAARPALALAEPESPGQSLGQPLAQAISPVYYRTKATYVFWMLRSMVGDPTLSAALRAYDPKADQPTNSGNSVNPAISTNSANPANSAISTNSANSANPASPANPALSPPFQTLLQQAGPRQNLSWFFSDWVNADKGLPDLAIGEVFPVQEEAGNWLVTVTVTNAGYAAAEVPITVRSGVNTVTQRVIIPARGKATPHMLIQGKPTEVQVNDGTVPETQASLHLKKLEPESPH